ncbi:MAG: hypothetical protein P8X64_04690 [Anaerolineales bacterium]
MIQHKLLLAILLLSLLGLSSCTQMNATPESDQLATAVSATLGSSFTPTPASPTTTATIPAPEPTLWMSYDGGGDQIWVLGDGLPYQRTLPVSVGGRCVAIEPANDLNTGQVKTLISDNVVEALWSPDGEAIAYILATPDTYELHWRGGDGSDRTLARNVTFTWSISPTGETIAFTRESGYELTIVPGFYAVQVGSGAEVRLSDIDKSGTGSTADFPSWSSDGTQVILSHYGGPGEARLVWARSDGTETHDLGLPTDAGEVRRDLALPFVLWDPDGEHLYAVPGEFGGEGEMGGPSPLVRYRLERTDYTLIEPETIGRFHQVLGWAVPGHSLWIWNESGIGEFILP